MCVLGIVTVVPPAGNCDRGGGRDCAVVSFWPRFYAELTVTPAVERLTFWLAEVSVCSLFLLHMYLPSRSSKTNFGECARGRPGRPGRRAA